MRRQGAPFICLIIYFAAVACGSFEGRRQVKKLPTQVTTPSEHADATYLHSPAHVLFAGVDPLAMPWQASIYDFDLTTHRLTLLLSGESGDPVLVNSGNDALLFNRTFASQNFRRFSWDGQSMSWGLQLKVPVAAIGDPRTALSLEGDRLLLANYTAGNLVLMQTSSGALVSNVALDWDLPGGASSLKPEALFRHEHDGRRYIYVLHQGLSLRDGLMVASGSGRIFVLTEEQGQITATANSGVDGKVAGIPLQGTLPVALSYPEHDGVLLVSLCSRYISHQNDQLPCRNAIEEFDPSTHHLAMLWDMAGSGLFMNGPIIAGSRPGLFYANVEQQEGPSTFTKKVVEVDTHAQAVREIYRFLPDSGGFWSSFYDRDSDTLWVSDSDPAGVGQLIGLDTAGTVQKRITLNHLPLSMIRMPTASAL